jgi:hypothetical protein
LVGLTPGTRELFFVLTKFQTYWNTENVFDQKCTFIHSRQVLEGKVLENSQPRFLFSSIYFFAKKAKAKMLKFIPFYSFRFIAENNITDNIFFSFYLLA